MVQFQGEVPWGTKRRKNLGGSTFFSLIAKSSTLLMHFETLESAMALLDSDVDVAVVANLESKQMYPQPYSQPWILKLVQ